MPLSTQNSFDSSHSRIRSACAGVFAVVIVQLVPFMNVAQQLFPSIFTIYFTSGEE